MNVPATQTAVTPGEIMENVIIKGDLEALQPADRARYYMRVCESIGLNPLTRPLEYIKLSGKLTLYAKRDCADQLRRLNGISIEIVSQTLLGDMFTVHVRASDRAGRIDEDFGVVTLGTHMKGDIRANTILKAITKAKRRVTLSISGLGFLDETEVEDVPASAKSFPAGKPTPSIQSLGPPAPTLAEEMNDEIPFQESAPPADPAPAPLAPQSPAGAGTLSDDGETETQRLDRALDEAAQKGWAELTKKWESLSEAEQSMMRAALNRRHKPTARAANIAKANA